MAHARFTTLRADAWTPWLLTCEHAAYRLPEGVRPTAKERALLRAHWGWDIGAWKLTRELSRRLNACAVAANWSRLWVDPNRDAGEATLIKPRVEGVDLSWNRGLSLVEIERRWDEYHAVYHAEVTRQIARRRFREIRPLIFSVHSFTERIGARRREFEIGILYDTHPRAAQRLGRRLRTAGLSVRYNQPYSGRRGLMYSAHRHGTHHGLTCLELEVNQALFERADTVARLGRILARALPGLDC